MEKYIKKHKLVFMWQKLCFPVLLLCVDAAYFKGAVKDVGHV